ncbi:MAG: GTP cyclohydrolase I FolE2 [Phycisphaeraceae bacterium]|nr:GTP cyclohydrolase I FolE2 [Phycisphaeraceae bacterium]
MPDVQGTSDTRRVPIDKVGVKNVTYPMTLVVPASCTGDGSSGGESGEQSTVATINMYVSLPHYQKGTHMSRFLEVLNEYSGPITPGQIPEITEAIRRRLGAADAHFEAWFTYFIRKFAPVTKMPGMMDYRVGFECRAGPKSDFMMTVRAPATSLCPCSKEISQFGAHNQRCEIEAKVRLKADGSCGTLWIEELVRIMERSASMELFAVLKRPDEKFVTEAAYENPKFVEDIIRDLALELDREDRITWYSITSENFESIHNHNAYAEITRDKLA